MRFRMLIAGVLSFATTALAQSPATQPASPPISGKLGAPLHAFNGKELAGWTWFSAVPGSKIENVWTVKDEILHSTGKPAGYLRTDREFGPDYILTIEYRHLTEGGGAFLFGINGPDKAIPKAVRVIATFKNVGEVVNQGDFNWFVEMERYRAKDRLIRMAEPSEKPLGEWNTVQIIVDHGNLAVTVNGVLQNAADGMDDVTGRIGLSADEAEMEFRKIDVTPIEKR